MVKKQIRYIKIYKKNQSVVSNKLDFLSIYLYFKNL